MILLLLAVGLIGRIPVIGPALAWAVPGSILVVVANFWRAFLVDRKNDRRIVAAARGRTFSGVTQFRRLVEDLRTSEGIENLVRAIRRQESGCATACLAVFDEVAIAAEGTQEKLLSWNPVTHLAISLRLAFRLKPISGRVSEKALDEIARLVAERTDQRSFTLSSPLL